MPNDRAVADPLQIIADLHRERDEALARENPSLRSCRLSTAQRATSWECFRPRPSLCIQNRAR